MEWGRFLGGIVRMEGDSTAEQSRGRQGKGSLGGVESERTAGEDMMGRKPVWQVECLSGGCGEREDRQSGVEKS